MENHSIPPQTALKRLILLCCFSPVLVALLSVLSPAWLLSMRLLAFHLGTTNAPGEAKADITAGEGALAGGRVVRIDALAASADGVEEVIDVEEQRQTTLEQVSAHATIHGEVRVNLGKQVLCATAIDGVGEHLQAIKPLAAIMLPKFRPEVQPQRVAEHIALGPLVGTVLNTVIVVDEVGIETDIHEVGWPQGGVHSKASVEGSADVERLAEGHDAPELVTVSHIGESASLVTHRVVPRANANAPEVVEIAFPTEFEIVSIAILQAGVASGIVVVAIDGEAGELRSGWRCDVVGVAEGEVVHRLGAVRGMDGRTEGEVMLAHVAVRVRRVLQSVPGIVHRQRRTEGEATEVVLRTSIDGEFVGAVSVIVTAQRVGETIIGFIYLLAFWREAGHKTEVHLTAFAVG